MILGARSYRKMPRAAPLAIDAIIDGWSAGAGVAADGTLVDATTLGTGTHGTMGTKALTASHAIVWNTGVNRLPLATLQGVTPYAQGNTNSMRFGVPNATNALKTAREALPAGTKKWSVGLWFLITSDGTPRSLYDVVKGVASNSGNDNILQPITNTGPVRTFTIETGKGGTRHAPLIEQNGPVYAISDLFWVTMKFNADSGGVHTKVFKSTDILNVYGDIFTPTGTRNETYGNLYWGNGQIGVGTGTNYFENIIIDYTNARFPLGPFTN